MLTVFSDEHFMNEALKEAEKARIEEEVPIGAVLVSNNRIIARAHNLTEKLNDVTAHAEMMAITAAANYLGGKYLEGCTLYVTLEPCIMCAGALHHAHISRIVWAADDEKRGFSKLGNGILHPKTTIENGVLAEKAKKLLFDFFQSKRAQ